eukprot:136727-Pelagomonas_calceolata.AAC.1
MSLKATRACVISRVVMQQLYSNLHFAGRGASIHQLSYPCRQKASGCRAWAQQAIPVMPTALYWTWAPQATLATAIQRYCSIALTEGIHSGVSLDHDTFKKASTLVLPLASKRRKGHGRAQRKRQSTEEKAERMGHGKAGSMGEGHK